MSDNEKCIIQIENDPHKNKTSKKKYFTINFIHLKHKSMSDSTLTNQCHCLHFQSVPSSSSYSLLTSRTSSLPFRNISSVSSTALDIQHFLKHFTVEIHHHALVTHWLYDTFKSSWLINIREPMKIQNCLILYNIKQQT